MACDSNNLLTFVLCLRAKDVVTTKLVPVTALPEVLELSYYANVVSPLFATESVLGKPEKINSTAFFQVRL